MSKTIVVFGVTGLIGSSVARALSRDYTVKGISRDPNSPKCQSLKSQGIDVIQIDISSSCSTQLDDALRGAYGCFVMTHADLTDSNCIERERTQGLAIGAACQRNNVQHIVYSTQVSVVRTIGLNARHMDTKADIERELKHMGLPVTGIIVPMLYENLLHTPLRPDRIDTDCYGLDIPLGRCSLNLISSNDVGPIVGTVFSHPQRWINKTFSVCGDKVTVPEIAAVLSGGCGVYFKDVQHTVDQWEHSHTYPGSQDFKAMFSFYSRVDQRASVTTTEQMYPNLQSLRDWVAGHTGDVAKALDFPDEPAQDPWACL